MTILKCLLINKSPGADLIEVTVLKWAWHIIGKKYSLGERMLKFSDFPLAWKEGLIRILLKGKEKDPADARLYRPVCLLSVIAKLFER